MTRAYITGIVCGITALISACGNQEGDTIPSEAMYQNIYVQVNAESNNGITFYKSDYVVGFNSLTILQFNNIVLAYSNGVESYSEQYIDKTFSLGSNETTVNGRDVPFDGFEFSLDSQMINFPAQYSVTANTDLLLGLESSISVDAMPAFTQDYSLTEYFSTENVLLQWQQGATTPVKEIMLMGCSLRAKSIDVEDTNEFQLDLNSLTLEPSSELETQCTLSIQLVASKTAAVNPSFAGGSITIEAISEVQEITVNLN